MKIAVGGKFYPLNPEITYGGERMFVYLAKEWARMGHEVTVFSQKGSWIPGCEIYEMPHVPFGNNEDIYANTIKNCGLDFDIAVLQDDTGEWNYPRLNIPYLFFAHGYRFPSEDKFCKAVVTASRVVGDKVKEKNVIIPIGIDGSLFLPSPKRYDYYVWLGKVWHSGIKPLHHAVEAVVNRKEKMFILAMIEDHAYFDKMVRPHIDGKNIILRENVGDDEKIAILSHAKALLSPQGYVETFGINHIEALSCGVPVIYNDPTDRFSQHAPIFYYAPEDIALRIEGSQDLSNKFAQKMEELKPDMAQKARDFFMKNFDIKIIAQKWITLMEENLHG